MKEVLVLAKYYEKFWKCRSCGREGISALRNTRCPGCGNTKVPQDQESFSRKEITDEVGLALAQGKPHWVCSSCGVANLDKNLDCDGCSSPRESDDHTNVVRRLDHLPIESPTNTQESVEPIIKVYPKATKQHRPAGDTFDIVKGKPSQPNKFLWIGLSLVVGVLFLNLIGYLIFHTETYTGEVTRFSWRRTIDIQEYQVESRSGWSTPPSDAYNVFQEERFHHTEDIIVTKTRDVYVSDSETEYTDLGNGAVLANEIDTSYWDTESYQEKVGEKSIYKTWYSYNVDRWSYSRSVTTQGNDREPEWGKYTLRFNGQQIIGAERVSDKTESYTVYFKAEIDKEKKTFSVSYNNQNDWQEYVIGKTYPIKVNHFGSIMNNPIRENEK